MAVFVAASVLGILQFLAENPAVGLAVKEEAELLQRRLSARARALWPGGPRLEFETVLADVAAANAMLARLAASQSNSEAGAPQQRVVLSLAWRGHPRTFLKALSLGRAIAALTGDVAVDVEMRPVGAASPSAATRRARCRAAAAKRAARSADGDAAADDDDEADEAFVDAVPVRRATLQQFYSFVQPCLMQILADDAAAARASARSQSSAAAADDEPDDSTCAICLDAAVDTVSPCAHAYCLDCYTRWRATARGCALCRAPLPAERGGTGAWVLAEAEEGEGAPPAAQPATAERLAAWVTALPLATA